jgi:hypothetical protein
MMTPGTEAVAEHKQEQRRKNIRLAWLLAAFALFILLSSVPFWQGLFELYTGGAGQ